MSDLGCLLLCVIIFIHARKKLLSQASRRQVISGCGEYDIDRVALRAFEIIAVHTVVPARGSNRRSGQDTPGKDRSVHCLAAHGEASKSPTQTSLETGNHSHSIETFARKEISTHQKLAILKTFRAINIIVAQALLSSSLATRANSIQTAS